jgi:hypothetical protein
MPRPSVSYLYILTVPYVAALSSISGPAAWGLHYTGFVWLSVFIVGLLLILRHRQRTVFPWKLWCPWLGYVLLSLTWGGIHGRVNLQDPAMMISPLVVGIVASYAIRTEGQLESLMRRFVHCLVFIVFVFIFFWYGPGAPYQADEQGYCVRPAAMTVAFIGCMFVGRLKRNVFLGLCGWAACLAVTVLSGSRMATLVLLVLWLITPLYFEFKSRLLVASVVCLLGLALFYSPIFQERFFPSEQHGDIGQVVEGDYDGSGRFEAWPVVWQEAQKNIVLGAGAGEVSRFTSEAHLDRAVSRPLNDYLRVVFEYGTFGLLILICTILKQMHVLHVLMRKSDCVGWALAAAYLGFFAVLIFAWSENVLVYDVYFMHPLFAVTGGALGVTLNKDL